MSHVPPPTVNPWNHPPLRFRVGDRVRNVLHGHAWEGVIVRVDPRDELPYEVERGLNLPYEVERGLNKRFWVRDEFLEPALEPATPTTKPEEPVNIMSAPAVPVHPTADMASRAVARGAETAAAAEANQQLVAIFRRHLGESWPPFFDTAGGQALAHAILPLALHYAVTSGRFPIPQPDSVKLGCELALEAASRDTLQPVIKALLAAATEFAGVVNATK